MEQFPDGLNFVPHLEGKFLSAPSSSRSRLSLTKKVSQKSLVRYNGNYEGDSSMFQEKGMLELQHLNLLADTDSETEFKEELEVYKEPQRIVKSARIVVQEKIWCLLQFYMLRYLGPEIVMKITQFVDGVYDSAAHGRLRKIVLFIRKLLCWISNLLMVIGTRIGCMSGGLWKSRAFFRNSTRRLLWCMTLAKCGDLLLFAFVLFCTPWLFLVAAMGFVISLYCTLRECLQRTGGFVRTRLMI